MTFYRARSVAVAETTSPLPVVVSEAGLPRRESAGLESDRSRSHAGEDVVAPL
jgi:hypothetical protein